MCRSQAEGGQRCAAHTRRRYQAAMTAMRAARMRGEGLAEARSKWEDAAVEYGSTTEGQRALESLAGSKDARGDIVEGAAVRSLAERGRTAREANAAAAEMIAQGGAARASRRDVEPEGPLADSVPVPVDFFARDDAARARHEEAAHAARLEPCATCGRGVAEETGWVVEITGGGDTIVRPGAGTNTNDPGYLGAWVVGPECGRKVPGRFRRRVTDVFPDGLSPSTGRRPAAS